MVKELKFKIKIKKQTLLLSLFIKQKKNYVYTSAKFKLNKVSLKVFC